MCDDTLMVFGFEFDVDQELSPEACCVLNQLDKKNAAYVQLDSGPNDFVDELKALGNVYGYWETIMEKHFVVFICLEDFKLDL